MKAAMIAVIVWTIRIFSVGSTLLASTGAARATELPSPEVRVTAGYSEFFLDEPPFFTAGGSLRAPVAPRIVIEPELAWMGGSGYSVWALSGNVVVDLSYRCSRACPYLIAGPVWLRETERGIYTVNHFVFQAGVGWRVKLDRNVLLYPEFRLGLGALPRVTLSVGWSLPRH